MNRLTNDDYAAIVEQAEVTLENLSSKSCRLIGEVIAGNLKEAYVHDVGDRDLGGTFTMAGLRKAWTQVAKGQGQTGYDFYWSGAPDSETYSEALEIAIFGEITYC